MKKLLPALLVIFLFALGCNLGSKGGGVPVSNRSFANDADFARESLTLLANGDNSVEGMLDWETFKVSGKQVGTQYNDLTTDTEREAFRKAFISSFSQSFKSTGASLDRVEKWQETGKEGDNTLVTASLPGAPGLVLTVTHRDGHQRLAAIEIASSK
jgi:hypothetical protein